jgi:stearoyl-CoA desaturase (delta-9 desaturase)
MIEAGGSSCYFFMFNMERTALRRIAVSVIQWFDVEYGAATIADTADAPNEIHWLRCFSLINLHLGCVGVFLVGWSWTAVGVAVALYLVRMFGITAIYHRYFAHRTFQTSRFMQFLFALLGASAAQRGPLWWAANHREHHRTSDTPADPHSPIQRGFWWSHAGWFMSTRHLLTNYSRIQDFARFRELVWLNRFDLVVPLALIAGLYLGGAALEHVAPALQVTGLQMVVWGFFISTTVLFHGTCTINSLAHLIGRPRYDTGDHSRNNFFLALITLGEGWHNNHHKYMSCARQGFYWWEIDVTYYILKALSWTGLIWDLRPVPAKAYDRTTQLSGERAAA